MMLRYGQRLCSALLHDRYATRWRFFCNTKPFSSQHADVDVAKQEEADDTMGAKVSIVDQTRSWRAVVRRPKTLTREPFVKNLFLGKFDTVSFILSYALFFLFFVRYCNFVSYRIMLVKQSMVYCSLLCWS